MALVLVIIKPFTLISELTLVQTYLIRLKGAGL